MSYNELSENGEHEIASADETGQSILQCLASMNLKAEFLDVQYLQFTRYLIRPEAGVPVAQVLSVSKDLQVQCGLFVEPSMVLVPGAIAIDVLGCVSTLCSESSDCSEPSDPFNLPTSEEVDALINKADPQLKRWLADFCQNYFVNGDDSTLRSAIDILAIATGVC